MENSVSHGTRAPERGGPYDRSRINMNDGYEVRYWARELDVSVEQIRAAVRKVGPLLDDVRRELKREGL